MPGLAINSGTPYTEPTSLVARLPSSAASTNPALVKGSAGAVYRISGANTVAAARYLKLFNKATAPTAGADIPIYVEQLEASSSFDVTFPAPIAFSAGIGYLITVNPSDFDATAIEAGDIVTMNIVYR